MHHGRYILDEHGEPRPEPDMDRWAQWYEDSIHDLRRRVANDTVEGCRISTVFLALDHSFSDDGPPVLWETMIFGGPLDQRMWRCAGSREQAEAQHKEAIHQLMLKLYEV